MRESTLTVGELGRRAGVGAKAIRFWEARGVLPPAARGANGYRLYAPETVEVLRFVRQAQDLGLSLAEIRQIAAIRRGGRPPCVHVRRLLAAKARELDAKLQALLALRRRVRASLAAARRAPAGPAAVCPCIETTTRGGDHGPSESVALPRVRRVPRGRGDR